jgi:hypothetical protein
MKSASHCQQKNIRYDSFIEPMEAIMPAKQPSWEERTKRFLKAELKRADVSYNELAQRLKKHGLDETEASVANKLSRGTFPATFFVAALAALEVQKIELGDI